MAKLDAKTIFFLQLLVSLCLVVVAHVGLFFSDDIRSFFIEEWETIVYLSIEQLKIFSLSAGFAIFIAFWSGYFLSKKPLYKYSNYVMQIFNITMAIPTLAMLSLAMLIFDIGFFSAWLALVFITLMPIVRNTFNAFKQLDATQIEAAHGMGMNGVQIFAWVELPQALPLIFSGIRTGLIFNIGSLPLIFLISADGLGELIFIGLRLDDSVQILIGSALTAVMAIMADILIHILAFIVTSKGITRSA